MSETNQSKYTYYAFISYKREDEKWAKWLQKSLETYGFPVGLRKDNPGLPSKIRPIFRDQSELSGGNLKDEIEKGLQGSKYLIVICSPRSAQSLWVSKEVQYFIDNGQENNIIPFIIGGIPNAKNPKEECFPEGLRQLFGEKEILGININEMGRDAAAIKVIARMFGLRFDTLWQRHERAKRRKRFVVIAGVTVFAIIGFLLAAVMTSLRNKAEEQRVEIRKEQIKLIVKDALDLKEKGECLPALRLITQWLPSSEKKDIPLVPEAMSALNVIINFLYSSEYKPVDKLWGNWGNGVVSKNGKWCAFSEEGIFYIYDYRKQRKSILPGSYTTHELYDWGSFQFSNTNKFLYGFGTNNETTGWIRWDLETMKVCQNNEVLFVNGLLEKDFENYVKAREYIFSDTYKINTSEFTDNNGCSELDNGDVILDGNNYINGDNFYTKNKINRFKPEITSELKPLRFFNIQKEVNSIEYKNNKLYLTDGQGGLKLYQNEDNLYIFEGNKCFVFTPFVQYSTGNSISNLNDACILNDSTILCIADQGEHLIYNFKNGKRIFVEGSLLNRMINGFAHADIYVDFYYLSKSKSILYTLSTGGVFIANDINTGKILYEFIVPKLLAHNEIIYENHPFDISNNERIIGMEINENKEELTIIYENSNKQEIKSYSLKIPSIMDIVDYAIYELDHFWDD